MTLEEKISFYTRDSATEFQKYLKEHDCTSRITTRHTLTGEPYIEGTITGIITLIDHLTAKEPDTDLETLKSDIIARRDMMTEFFAEHKPDDLITESTPNQLLAQIKTIHEEGTDIEKLATENFTKSLTIFETLEENGLLEKIHDTESYRLTAVKSPDELKIIFPYNELTDIQPEELKEANLSLHIHTSSTTEYIITTGIELPIADTWEDIEETLDELDIETEEAERFTEMLFYKQMLISTIIETITNGARSEKDILKALNAHPFPLGDTGDVISYDITPEYLTEVLTDLRKTDILAGKDGKIKTL